MSGGHLQNTRFCRLRHSWRRPDLQGEYLVLVTTNTTGKCPVVTLKTAGFGHYKLGWKCLQVSLKTPGSVATNTARDDPTSCEKYPQTRQEIARGLLKHTQFWPPQTGWRCAEVFLKNIKFLSANTQQEMPRLPLNATNLAMTRTNSDVSDISSRLVGSNIW